MLRKVLVIAMAIFVLAGCGKSTTTSEGGEKGVIELTYLSTTIIEVPEGVYEQAIIDEFNALDNGIHVTVESVNANDLMTKIITLATANQMPDFFMINQMDMATLIDMELLTPLEPIFGEKYIAEFSEVGISSSQQNGVTYGIPWFTSGQGVLYRKDIFDEKGLVPPTTWDEFVQLSIDLTDGENYGNVIVGSRDGSGGSRFQPILRNFGVDEFILGGDGKWTTDIGSDKFIDALKAYTDLDVVHGTVPPGVTETNYPAAVGLFSSGRGAMLITGSNAIGAVTSQVPELKGKLGSFALPVVERSVSIAGGFSYGITSGKNEEASAEFIKFMVNKENAIGFSVLTGRLPTRIEAAEDPVVTSMPELSGFLEALGNVYVVPAIPGYSEINDILGEAYQSVFIGTSSVEEAAAKAKKRAQAMCDDANEN